MKLSIGQTGKDVRKAYVTAGLIVAIGVAMFFLLVIRTEASQGACSQTANTLFAACNAGVTNDSLVKKAICINLSDTAAREKCLKDVETERDDEAQACKEQRDWRLESCKLLGENRYDPNPDPAKFDRDFKRLTNPNPYFPLTIGNQWKYAGGNEVNIIEILNETKVIDGVPCIVFRDKVYKDGNLVENTDDWFAQHTDRNVWYFGEEVKDYETFESDNPKRPELVSIDGSFKAGRDDARAGSYLPGLPKKDNVYLEEFSLGNAEDVTVILSSNYSFGKNAELDQYVPKTLMERFCNGDCIVTKNFSLLEPDIFARKYYAKGVGLILEVEPGKQLAIQLVECNFNSKCNNLPTP